MNKCSLDLMLLVIDNENDKLSKLRTEIGALETELSDKLSSDKLKEIADDCAKKMETYKRELEQHKMEKYKRDAYDYKEDRVYPWLTGRTKPTRPLPYHKQSSTSASSDALSTDTESHNSQRFLRSGRQLSQKPPPSTKARGRGRGNAPKHGEASGERTVGLPPQTKPTTSSTSPAPS